MDGYKNYIMPGAALLLLLAWFFVIQPRMAGTDEETGSPSPTTRTTSEPDSAAKPEAN